MADTQLLRFSVDIVAAHLGHNKVAPAEVPDLIRSVFDALGRAGAPSPVTAAREPAVPVKKSVFPGYLICLEDGKKLKMLKRHLQSSYGLTPDQYRTKWGLPPSYPMTAPDYAEHRSALAKNIGLGRRAAAPPPTTDVPVQKIPAGKRGRQASVKKAKSVETETLAD